MYLPITEVIFTKFADMMNPTDWYRCGMCLLLYDTFKHKQGLQSDSRASNETSGAI